MIIYKISVLQELSLSAYKRMVGFFGTQEKAEYVITWNIGDIYENGYYPFAVIEKLEEGMYPVPTEETWFRWYDDVGYILMDKPKYEER